MAPRSLKSPGEVIGRWRYSHVKADLEVSIKNFGPISDGKIKLKPLTVFIGPNSSGKSYAAMLVHSILTAENDTRTATSRNQNYSIIMSNISYTYKDDIEKIIKMNKNKQPFFMPSTLTQDMTHHIVQDIFKPVLEDAISRNFGCKISKLVTAGKRSSEIRVYNSSVFEISINKKLSVKHRADDHTRYGFTTTKNPGPPVSNKNSIIIPLGRNGFDQQDYATTISYSLPYSLIEEIKQKNVPLRSFYFPSSRSGILQGHKALSASIVKNAPYAGFNPLHIPKITGTVSDFISNIIMLEKKPGYFYKLARNMESELLGGEIDVITDAGGQFPEIVYNSKKYTISLPQTSATISEIAPLSLYLKYILAPGDMLVIEEPEAHLHPSNQAILAKYVTRMIRGGINVLLTTHSVLLLNEISKYMRLSKTSPKDRKKFKLDEDDYLEFGEVAAHVFESHDKSAYTIKEIKADTEFGIPEDEFIRVHDMLYKDEIKLQKILGE